MMDFRNWFNWKANTTGEIRFQKVPNTPDLWQLVQIVGNKTKIILDRIPPEVKDNFLADEFSRWKG